MTYCEYIKNLPEGPKQDLHSNYNDNHYGFPLHDDNELFGRLIPEINQAGLNREITLKKAPAFSKILKLFIPNAITTLTLS